MIQVNGEPTSVAALPEVSWETLEKSLAHSHPVVRAKGIEAISRLDDPRVVSVLEAALKDADRRVRLAAMVALHSVAQDAQIDILQLFQSCEIPARLDWLTIFRDRRDIDSDSNLPEMLSSDPAPEVRMAVLEIMLASPRLRTHRTVIERLVDEDPQVRSMVEAVLPLDTNGWFRSPAAGAALGRLQRARDHLDADVQRAAILWSDRIYRAQLRQSMISSGLAGVMALTNALRSSHGPMRQAAAEGLMHLGDHRAIPALVESLRDNDCAVRRAGALALHQLNWQPAVESDQAYFLVALGRVSPAADLGEVAVDALLHAVVHSHSALQAKVIECLAERRCMRAMIPLVPLLHSNDGSVRRAAANALNQLEWMPVTAEQAIAFAIELGDWKCAVSHGSTAVAPMIQHLKSIPDDVVGTALIADALRGCDDPASVAAILPFCRDGHVAGKAIEILEGLLERFAVDLSPDLLRTLANLPDSVQFNFALEHPLGRSVRTGFEVVSAERVRELAVTCLNEPAPERLGEQPMV